MPSTSFMGATVRRREDPRLITGSSSYVDDMILPGLLYMAILRSPYAHARVRAIDVTAARILPGVAAAVSGHDLGGLLLSGADNAGEDGQAGGDAPPPRPLL